MLDAIVRRSALGHDHQQVATLSEGHDRHVPLVAAIADAGAALPHEGARFRNDRQSVRSGRRDHDEKPRHAHRNEGL